jgi:uncharacterized RDD family membrane protein YckC
MTSRMPDAGTHQPAEPQSESTGISSAPEEPHDTERRDPGDPDVPQVRPWIRFLARGIDINLWLLLVYIFYYAIRPLLPGIPDGVLAMIGLFLYNFVEPVSFALYGTTVGKWFLKVYVRTVTGEHLTYGRALGRTFGIWIKGLALGIPLLNLIAMGIAFGRLTENKVTDWDREGRFRVYHGRVGALRTVIMTLLVLCWLTLTIAGFIASRSGAA